MQWRMPSDPAEQTHQIARKVKASSLTKKQKKKKKMFEDSTCRKNKAKCGQPEKNQNTVRRKRPNCPLLPKPSKHKQQFFLLGG